MNKLILCEGKVDAILLSYYLERTCGWTHKNNVKNLDIKINEANNEYGYWYNRGDENLLICGVGGKDNFNTFFKNKIHDAVVHSSAFSRIAVVTDRDNRQISSIQKSLKSAFQPIISIIENNAWTSNTYRNSFGQQIKIDFLMLVIPSDNEGALETLLLDAISEDPYDEVIVNKCKMYIDEIEPHAKKYIKNGRLKLKACLGVALAVQYPEKIFTLIDEQIRSVKWENSDLLEKCFNELKKI